MREYEQVEDIYKIDTNGMDLASGIEEQENIDVEELIRRTKEKLHKKEKPSLRQRFSMANTFVKAAVVAGMILAGGTTVAAAVQIANYIPNMGITHSNTTLTLPVPYTTTVKTEASNGEIVDYYLRVMALSYDGRLLQMDLETNYKEVLYNEQGEEEGRMYGFLYLNGKEGVVDHISDQSYETHDENISRYHEVFKVEEIEECTLILPVTSGETCRFELPLKELTLVEPEKVTSLEEFGEVAEDKNIRLVAVQSIMNGMKNIDVIPSKEEGGITFDGLQEYQVKDASGKVQRIINDPSCFHTVSYLLFETSNPTDTSVKVSKIQVSKKINETVSLTLPNIGQAITLNQKVSLEDMDIVIKSIRVDDTIDKESGGYWVEVISELQLPDGSSYAIEYSTQIKNTLSYKGIEQSGYSFNSGKTFINMVIPESEMEPGAVITLQLDSVKGLVLSGDWMWELKNQ